MAVSANMQYVYNRFIAKGYSPTLAAGLAANFAVETGGGDDIIPTAVNPDNGAFGIANWLDEGRQNAFYSYMENNGLDANDLDNQIDYVDYELHNSSMGYLNNIQNSDLSTPEAAANAVATYYEGSGDQAINLRMQRAADIYSMLYDGSNYDPSSVGDTTSGGTDTTDYTQYLPDDMMGIDQSMYQRLGMIFAKARELGVEPILTAGATDDSHTEGSWHYKGLGADIAWNGLQWGDEALGELAEYARSLGFQEVISDPHGTGPHLHIANPDFSKEVSDILGAKGDSYNFGEGIFQPSLQNKVDPEIFAKAQANYQAQMAYENALKAKPTILEGIWHDFKRSGNFAYDYVDALYTDLFHSDLDAFGKSKITDADKQYIKAAMGKGNEAEAQWIIDNAKDQTQLYYLLQRKTDDMQEDQKYANYYSSIGTHTIGTVLGAVLDPLNALPELKAVQAAKIMKTLGGTVKNVAVIDRTANAAAKTLAGNVTAKERILNTTANMAAMGALQQHAANTATGDHDSVAGAALLAGISGGVLRTLGMAGGKVMKRQDPSVQNIVNTANRIQEATAREAVGLKQAYSVLEQSKKVASEMHDATFLRGQKGKAVGAVAERDNVFALSLEDAKKLGSSIGVNVTDNAKGFYVPHGDYAVIIKDNIKNSKELEGVIAHEVGVHQSLKTTIGDEKYNSLMDFIMQQQKDTSSLFAQAARKAGSTEPEEVLGYAVEHGMIGRKAQGMLSRAFREGLKAMGVNKGAFSNKEILDMVDKALKYNKLRAQGIVVNDDGTVIQNGIKFSKDNLVAPESLMDYERMADLREGVLQGKTRGGKVLNWLSDKMDNTWLTRTPFGTSFHSPSPTLSRWASRIWEDAQRRGAKREGSNMMSAERIRGAIVEQINKPLYAILDARQQWIKDHYGTLGVVNPFRGGDAHRLEFDKMVIDLFNHESKQATHINLDESMIDENVRKAVESLKRLYDTRVDIGKRSSTMFGGDRVDNLIDKHWYSVDDEFHRLVDIDRYRDFVSNFTTTGDKGARNYLKEYALKASNTEEARGLISEMIKRQKVVKIQNEMDTLQAKMKRTRRVAKRKEYEEQWDALHTKLSETKAKDTPDEDIDAFREQKAPEWADRLMTPIDDKIDGRDIDGRASELGDLTFLRGRLPMDTGMILPIKDAEGNIVKEFSFDNDLRYYDLEHILNRTNSRYAGEAAVKAVIGGDVAYAHFMKEVLHELNMASLGNKGRINSSTAEKHKRWFMDNMARMRGMRDSYSRQVFDEGSAVVKILNNMAYNKRGGSMGWNQLGDLGGAIAYGGVHQLFGVFNPLRRLVQKIRLGKENADFVDDLQWHVFGEPIERHIFRASWGDTQTRNALAQRGHSVGNVLAGIADVTHNIGKFTSQINMLGHMTDTMVRSMRSGFITDSIRWAHGEKFSSIRNPFSEANIKALGRSVNLKKMQEDLRKYIDWDGQKGTIAKGEKIDQWQRESPQSFWDWYDLAQIQTEKGVLLSTSEGNRNMLKDMNGLARLNMMFKDFTMRSNNAQFMRALQQHEVQDVLAFVLSVGTNVAAFAARNGAKMAALYALGNTEAADYIKDNYLNDMALGKAALFRSGFLSPISYVNDAWEGATGAPTIRTTVTQYRQKNNAPKDIGDYIGNTIQQLPSVDTFSDMFVKPALAASRLATDKGTQKDLRAIMNMTPLPDFIPMTQIIDTLSRMNNLPTKKGR